MISLNRPLRKVKVPDLILLVGMTTIFTGSALTQIYPSPPPTSPTPAPPTSPTPAPPTSPTPAPPTSPTPAPPTSPTPAPPTSGGASGSIPNHHIGFDQPEAWALKRFTAATLPSGIEPPASAELRRIGAVSVGLETDWLPALDAGQQRVGFDGAAPEDLNKAPVLVRPVVGVQLPWKLRVLAFAPIPISTFGIKSRLFAFGVERPLIERRGWTVGWQGSGQVGSVKGAFTCPQTRLAFPPGSSGNPTNCVGTSEDVATLQYAGMAFQVAHPLARMPKLIPHVSVGGYFVDAAFQSHAPVTFGLAQQHEWTHGGIFSTTGGVTYMFNQRIALTVNASYSPLGVIRNPGDPQTNDGLFNVRTLLSYHF
jgi:hypothetical protein